MLSCILSGPLSTCSPSCSSVLTPHRPHPFVPAPGPAICLRLQCLGPCSGGFLSPTSRLNTSSALGHGRCSAYDRWYPHSFMSTPPNPPADADYPIPSIITQSQKCVSLLCTLPHYALGFNALCLAVAAFSALPAVPSDIEAAAVTTGSATPRLCMSPPEGSTSLPSLSVFKTMPAGPHTFL